MNLSLLLAERSIDHFVPPTPDSSPPARTHRSRSRSPKGSELAPKSRPMTPNPPFSSAANRSTEAHTLASGGRSQLPCSRSPDSWQASAASAPCHARAPASPAAA